jgi:hypothetical protein
LHDRADVTVGYNYYYFLHKRGNKKGEFQI